MHVLTLHSIIFPFFFFFKFEEKRPVPCRDVHPLWSRWKTGPRWRRHWWCARWWMSWWTGSLPAGWFPLPGWRPLPLQSSSRTRSHLTTDTQTTCQTGAVQCWSPQWGNEYNHSCACQWFSVLMPKQPNFIWSICMFYSDSPHSANFTRSLSYKVVGRCVLLLAVQ